MASLFVSTLRSLEHRNAGYLGLLPGLALLGAWIGWMAWAEVDVYASATRGRLEVSRMARRMAVQEGGRLVTLHCELGRRVEQGELVAEIDTGVERAELERDLVELKSLDAKLLVLRDQVRAEQARRGSRARLDELAAEQADLGLRQALATASKQRELSQITEDLNAQRLASRVEALNASGLLETSRIGVSGASVELERQRAAHDYEDKTELAKLAEINRQLSDIEGERQVKLAASQTARLRIERARVTAPASGELGNVAPLQVGDVVKTGDVLATVIPPDDMRVVAEFPPDVAVGRILPGQSARVRLAGFSWVEFGMLDASVSQVASEPNDGSIRVELQIHADRLSGIPLQHGLPGSVDVLLEHVSPWTLLTRSIGATLARPRSNDAAALPLARQESP